MLTRRNKALKSTASEEDIMNKKTIKNGDSSPETSQWVMIAPDNLLDSHGIDEDKQQSPIFHKFPHPKSGQPTMYVFKSQNVFEVMKFKEPFRSWFINDSVQADGSLHILTPMDPLFMALPILDKVAKTGKYMTQEQLFIDNEYQVALSKVESCLTNSTLDAVCECKGSGDCIAYKLSSEKVLSWLTAKVENLADHLKKQNLHVGSGSKAANFVKSSHNGGCSHGDYMQYAFGLISDYIADEWVAKLKDKMQLQETSAIDLNIVKEEQPPAKKQKLNDGNKEACLEDYRDAASKTDKTKKVVKLTIAQKQLAKVDKTGMKSLTKFFSPKQKSK